MASTHAFWLRSMRAEWCTCRRGRALADNVPSAGKRAPLLLEHLILSNERQRYRTVRKRPIFSSFACEVLQLARFASTVLASGCRPAQSLVDVFADDRRGMAIAEDRFWCCSAVTFGRKWNLEQKSVHRFTAIDMPCAVDANETQVRYKDASSCMLCAYRAVSRRPARRMQHAAELYGDSRCCHDSARPKVQLAAAARSQYSPQSCPGLPLQQVVQSWGRRPSCHARSPKPLAVRR